MRPSVSDCLTANGDPRTVDAERRTHLIGVGRDHLPGRSHRDAQERAAALHLHVEPRQVVARDGGAPVDLQVVG